MNMYGYEFYTEQDLLHYGVKGMHWGTRRWQNEDGTFNSAGKERYFGKGTGEDYHPVKSGASSSNFKTSGSSSGKSSSFDKERAKKIAKGVAIGAAVVGGTVLVAYGGKKLHDAGVLDKIRDGKLQNQKLMQNYKTEMLQIKTQAKEKRAQIVSDTKTKLAQIKENEKLNTAAVKMDPTQRLNPNILKKEIAGSHDQGKLKEFVQSLNDDEVSRINSGSASLHDIRKERAINGWSVNQEKYRDYYNQHKEYFGNADQVIKATQKAGQAAANAGKKAYAVVTSEQAKTVYKKTADIGKKAVEKAYKTATSDQAKATYKKAGQTTSKVAKTAAKKTADYVKSGQAKKDVKETTKLIGKAASTAADIAKASPQLIAEYKKGNLPGQQTMKSSRNAQIVRQYKKEHPNTKLSDAEIVENYG